MKQIVWSLLIFLFLYDILYKNFLEKPNAVVNIVDDVVKPNINEASSFEVKEIKTIKEDSDKEERRAVDDEVVLHVRHCSTHAKSFDELKKELVGNYTNIELIGGEYPLPFAKKILSKALYAVQMLTMVLLIGGKWLKNYLTFIPDRVFTFIEEKRFMIGITNFFVIGQLSNMLNTSGAFEVIHNGSVIWSKLDLKMLPTAKEIVTLLSNKGVELI